MCAASCIPLFVCALPLLSHSSLLLLKFSSTNPNSQGTLATLVESSVEVRFERSPGKGLQELILPAQASADAPEMGFHLSFCL